MVSLILNSPIAFIPLLILFSLVIATFFSFTSFFSSIPDPDHPETFLFHPAMKQMKKNNEKKELRRRIAVLELEG